MEERIELTISKSISRLAGNAYGQEIYNKQVKDKINLSNVNVIVIPDYIEDIAISFVQGFTLDLLNKISKEDFLNHITIEAKEKVKNKFMKAVFF